MNLKPANSYRHFSVLKTALSKFILITNLAMLSIVKTLVAAFSLISFSIPLQAEETVGQRWEQDQIKGFYLEAAEQWNEIPQIVLLAFVAGEDRYFFDRPVQNSTITRQVGFWYLQPNPTRLERMALAIQIGKVLTHDEVLEWYVNEVFLGQSCGNTPIFRGTHK